MVKYKFTFWFGLIYIGISLLSWIIQNIYYWTHGFQALIEGLDGMVYIVPVVMVWATEHYYLSRL